MAKMKMAFFMDGLSGKVEPDSNLVCRTRNGKPHIYKTDNTKREWSATQTSDRALFGKINSKVSEEMKDLSKKAYWNKLAKKSKGKIKSGRSAAWAYWKEVLSE